MYFIILLIFYNTTVFMKNIHIYCKFIVLIFERFENCFSRFEIFWKTYSHFCAHLAWFTVALFEYVYNLSTQIGLLRFNIRFLITLNCIKNFLDKFFSEYSIDFVYQTKWNIAFKFDYKSVLLLLVCWKLMCNMNHMFKKRSKRILLIWKIIVEVVRN